jgi:peptidoglycan hydrolase-like protein with peptidoglycan-binding domain
MYVTWLADVLRDAGCKVEEVPGWETRGVGEMVDVKGVICHHTSGNRNGNDPTLPVIIHGRDDLPGPLSQLLLGRDGTFHVVAAGKCNHAGKGSWHGVTAGNSNFIGIEAENDGISEPWSDIEMEAYIKGVAAILTHVGADSVMAAGHKEYALPKGRKVDPTFDMYAFRDHVENLMRVGATQPLSVLPVPHVDPVRSMLRKGDMGASVFKLQEVLGVRADGQFGPNTEKAVESFQRRKGLNVDGKVGPQTWAALGVS